MEVRVEGFGTVTGTAGDTLLEICEEHDIPMDCACGGFAACNSCRVIVLEGMANLSPRLEEEEPFLDKDHQRLGCQARVTGPVFVRLDSGM